MKKLVIIFVVLVTPLLIQAQRSAITKGDSFFDSFQYDLAKDHYEKALNNAKEQNEKAEVAYKLGYCYKMLGDSEKSEIYFAIAVKNYTKGVIKPDVLLFYADALRMNGKYETAIEVYKRYTEVVPDDYRGKSGLESCKVAPKWINRPSRFKVTNTAKFNTSSFDFSPAWASKDFKTIYFTSSREGVVGTDYNNRSGQRFTDIFETAQDRKGVWDQPKPITGNINTGDDEGAMVLSSKGTEMYYTKCIAQIKQDIPCKIYYTTKKGNAWGEPVWVDFQGFSTYEVGYPALSPDEKTLYFSANTPEGYGGMDIYMAKKIGNTGTSFERPINMGPIINTIGDEVYPTIQYDGTLYFSSDAHEGMGGLDIFKTIKDAKGNIIGIENLKPPINSSFDDFGIIFSGRENNGYFSSNRKGGKGSDDIYSFSLPPLTITLNGVVRDTTDQAKIKLLKGAKLKVNNDNGLVAEIESGNSGDFIFKLQDKQNYKLSAEVDDYYFATSVDISTFNVEYDTVFNVEINLGLIPRVITLPNIIYDYDKATLKPESTVSLDGLVKTLKDNPKITIELRSHTDYRGNDEYNMNLSQERAKSCVDYLISKGIDAKRLTSKGMGESDPKIIDEELAKKYSYFKVGDKLTESYIIKLKTDQQEVANQINRRTEFSVLSKDYGTNAKTIEEVQIEKEQQQEIKKGSAIINDTGDDF
ncbi:MAG: OmpA family protein [Bacteroidales bacterium]|jgi:peptidoglycan-associated lipoprotein|nr:OmpA family protein [Bacteroidales bacterium]